MTTVELEIELLTPTAMSASSRSLGVATTRETVSGRVLWGIAVAAAATRNDGDLGRLLSGEVRFTDALPSVSGERALPVPRTWFREKRDSEGPVRNAAHGPIESGDTQLENVPAGWITTSSARLRLRRVVALKTAVDRDQRPREGLLFGMELLDAGSTFSARVSCDDRALLERVAASVVGIQRIGRSRGAEFGRAAIRRVAESSSRPAQGALVDAAAFLVVTPVVVRDAATGAFTFAPTAKQFGLPEDWTLDAARSALRTISVSPFNATRQRPEIERAAIDAGSVLVFVGRSAVDASAVEAMCSRGIGEYTHEGYGEVSLNPVWVTEPRHAQPIAHKRPAPTAAQRPGDALLAWATARSEQSAARTRELAHAKEVAERVHKSALTTTQWGELHALARQWAFAGHDAEGVREQFGRWAEDGTRGHARRWGATIGGTAVNNLVKAELAHATNPAVFLELLASQAVRKKKQSAADSDRAR